jgi:hypothetical protein
MKKVFIFSFLFFVGYSYTQNLVRINKLRNNVADTNFDPEAYYSATDFVKYVLIPAGGDCVNVQNVVVEPATNNGVLIVVELHTAVVVN